MDNFKCIVATKQDVINYYDEKISNNPTDESLKIYKNHFVSAVEEKTRICYFGILNNQIICKTTAVVSLLDRFVQNKENLIDNNTAYLTAFQTKPEFEGKGYFSKLYKFMEQDLKKRGFKKLTLGVEPCEVRNMQIYFHLGYTKFIKHGFETYEPITKCEKGETVLVCFYEKKL